MISLDNVKQVLIDSKKDNPINEVIVNEMIDVLNEYIKCLKNSESKA